MIKIDNWYVFGNCLKGHVTDHPKLGAGDVRTSYIVRTEGRIIHTYSGSSYKLGKIHQGYKKLLKNNHPDWNWRNPLACLHKEGN